MVDALVGATAQVLLEKAISVATDSIGLTRGLKKDIESLRGSAEMICAVLADAEEKRKHDRAVQRWLQRLEGVAFDADNVLDELNYEDLRRKVEASNQTKGKVCFFFSFSKTNIAFRWRMASKIRDINMRLNEINQEANNFELIRTVRKEAVLAAVTTGVTVSRTTDSKIGQKVVGRANNELEIVDMLLSFTKNVVSVLPIVGMGGLGKTTLAKLVYNNQRIHTHFNKKIWVCVSEKFEVMELFKLILESLTQTKVDMDSRDAIVQKIQKEVEGQRYLLVLDDVWNQNQQLWEDFFGSLVGLGSTNGSWCLVTTRLREAASIVATNPLYSLNKLSDDDCWSILKEKVTAGGEVPGELNVKKKEILQRCSGLPLAASVLGGLLRRKGKEEWLSILGEWLSDSSGDEDSVMQILKLSFDYLPSPSIKNCFAYCSMFAKDTEMRRDELIELWMAEGFLQPDLQKHKMMEEIGDDYLKILLQSSLLEEIVHGWRVYKMHDLVHDLAKSVLKSGSINLETNVIDQNNQARYLVVNTSGEKTVKLSENVSTSVRTLFLESSISGETLSKFKNLHVLKLSSEETSELPTSIGKLTHLRYIAVWVSEEKTLPESLCKLYNLQTLRICPSSCLNHLPMGMSNLISLRHLHYYDHRADFLMPLHMGRLSCLQTLKFFNVGQEKGRQIEELGCLKDLRGKLVIRNPELVKRKEGAEQANLYAKANLFRLEFEWDSWNQGGENCDEDVLEGLRPHPNLQELKISNFWGDQFPRWFMNLSALVSLELQNCKRCKQLPAGLGQLQFLQRLLLAGLEDISSIGLPFYGIDDQSIGSFEVLRKSFPALKTLILRDMENLEEWTEAEGEVFPVLESLTIKNCSKLTTAPSHFPSLKELWIEGNDHVLVVKDILSKATTTISTLGIKSMAGLTCVSDVAAGPHNYLSNLKALMLMSCPNLISTRGCGTSLESLWIEDCDNLSEFLEDQFQFQSLCRLMIEGCPRILNLNGLQHLTCLELLTISCCDGLTDLPGEMLHSSRHLRRLVVSKCPNLVSFTLDLQQMPSLSEMKLFRCPNLKTNMMPRGFGSLTSLKDLSIGPISDDDENSAINESDWAGLVSTSTLRDLRLYGLLHTESLPDQLQYLTSLIELHLIDFGIEALPDWMGNLASLRYLYLWNCEKLRYLPSMDALKRLTKLTCLEVSGSPLLTTTELTRSNHDRQYKIPHIPHLDILFDPEVKQFEPWEW